MMLSTGTPRVVQEMDLRALEERYRGSHTTVTTHIGWQSTVTTKVAQQPVTQLLTFDREYDGFHLMSIGVLWLTSDGTVEYVKNHTTPPIHLKTGCRTSLTRAWYPINTAEVAGTNEKNGFEVSKSGLVC